MPPSDQPSSLPTELTVDQALQLAVYHHRAGRLPDAEKLYRAILQAQPKHPDANHNLGILAVSVGKQDVALGYLKAALEANPKQGQYWVSYIDALIQANQLDAVRQVLVQGQRIGLSRDAEAHFKLANALKLFGQFEDAEISYRQATVINPMFAEAHCNLGNTLRIIGRYQDAEASYRQAIATKPKFAEAYNNLGSLFRDIGRVEEAVNCYQQAMSFRPNFAEAHCNLGNSLRSLGRLEEAEFSYRQALTIMPDYAQAKTGYAECLAAMRFDSITPAIYEATATALSEAWTRPSLLSGVACNLLLLNPTITHLTASNTTFHPTSILERYDTHSFEKLGKDPLLLALLTSVPVPDLQLERLLTNVRFFLLQSALKGNEPAPGLPFFCALAHQCFINEYVFPFIDKEIQQAEHLRELLVDALKNAANIPQLWVIGVACYFPLYSVGHSEALFARTWPNEIINLLKQQIDEPLEELRLKQSIQVLTQIEDGVSIEVRSQYEENPYPRWVKAPNIISSKPIIELLRDKFPIARMLPMSNIQHPDILIAGSGTGQHSIETAQVISGANVLAIDLSLTSLAFAKRKALEMGIHNIDFAQADILKLNSIARSFDVIESAGVLHHLKNPFDGWRLLVSLLRPNGLMRLGFYSKIARRHITKARNLLSKCGYSSTPNGIRAARQYLIDIDSTENLGNVARTFDFFSLSTCKDLLFHVQEKNIIMQDINDFIVNNYLMFLGFEFINPAVINTYKLQFPDDIAAQNLKNWQVFEQENPEIFSGMYQFWVQKYS